MSVIVLSTLNARYIHSAFGLRYLKANMGPLEDNTEIMEFTVHERPIDIAERILQRQPKIIGFGIYIWNIIQTTELVALIKQIRPETIIILGGPEISYEQDQQTITSLADYIICGAADKAFSELCIQLYNDQPPGNKLLKAANPKLAEIKLPYYLYNDEDISNRIIYVEASRGCPFKCEFCLSALDKTALPFGLEDFLVEIGQLYQRGARHFKFVDRTFNLKIDQSITILEFFLEHMDDELFLHFELIPDHLPEKIKEVIKRFPAGTLQFEIGVQTFNPETQQLISRKQNNLRTIENLQWIREQSYVHIHADLIIGLPGEDINSFANGFDRLVELKPHEIQIGILKRLRGSPIIRHANEFDMRYNPQPPYNILANNLISFSDMQRLNRFARYWDILANSGRFKHTIPALLGHTPFNNFMALSDWLYHTTQQTHKLALPRLFKLIHQAGSALPNIDTTNVESLLIQDFMSSGIKGQPSFSNSQHSVNTTNNTTGANKRQSRH